MLGSFILYFFLVKYYFRSSLCEPISFLVRSKKNDPFLNLETILVKLTILPLMRSFYTHTNTLGPFLNCLGPQIPKVFILFLNSVYSKTDSHKLNGGVKG